ncbi:NUDIX domain-containing protein [Protaetiibacter larvae]|uniref:NUDIX domain-containing protein n=1 Tax=Protaetiibacter larvae TaxID=2592654 RepID=UPI001FE59332|nr:NUDIX hydrolase [Protaetiibacter larvae]
MSDPTADSLAALLSGPLADLPETAEVVGRQRVYAGRVWDVVRERFRFAGHELERDFVAHTGAVAVLAVSEDGKVLLINQYRHPIRSRDWELPAGLLDVPGEEPLEAAKRELAEEVDLVASEWRELLTFATSPGGSDEHVVVFEARGLTAAPEAYARTEEEAQLVRRWASLDEVVEAALAGRIRNSILLLAVLAAHARG